TRRSQDEEHGGCAGPAGSEENGSAGRSRREHESGAGVAQSARGEAGADKGRKRVRLVEISRSAAHGKCGAQAFGGVGAMNVYDVIRRPLITEKSHLKREAERTLCFEVHPDANKIQIKQAVETVFRVKVAEVRTSLYTGKLRRRGRFTGYASEWKKAYVRLQEGQRVPEYADI